MKTALLKVQKGFTLIELLVVIGILGILAAALIATIDPLEQLKKAQDANTKNATVEYINATTRYYATHNAFPWTATTATPPGAGCNSSAAPSGSYLNSAGMITCTTALTNEKELKPDFASSAYLSKIAITYDTTQEAVIGCFTPESASQRRDVLAKYTMSGVLGVGCISTGGATVCSWCGR